MYTVTYSSKGHNISSGRIYGSTNPADGILLPKCFDERRRRRKRRSRRKRTELLRIIGDCNVRKVIN